MSEANARAFREKVNADPKLQEKVRETIAGGYGGVVALGRENGYKFSEADLDKIYGGIKRSELTPIELDLVVSGAAGVSAEKC
jgi:predicted ribosomally synthesized peptide with nif11-like leader